MAKHANDAGMCEFDTKRETLLFSVVDREEDAVAARTALAADADAEPSITTTQYVRRQICDV